MLKNILFSVLVLLVTVVFAHPVQAGFGASPATLFKENILPGSSFTQEIIVSRSDPDEDLNVIIEPELKDMATWVTFPNSQKVLFPKGQNRLSLPLTVAVPKNIANKSYNGAIRIKAVSINSQEGISVAKGARVDVNFIVSTTPVKDIDVRSINVENTKTSQPIYATIVVENKGNTQAWPSKVTMDIYDLQEKLVESLETTDLSVNSGEDQFNVVAKFTPKADLQNGDYIAQTKVYMGSKVLRNEKLLFKVLGASTVNAQESEESPVYENPTSNKITPWYFIVLFFIFLILINAIATFLIRRFAKPQYLAWIIAFQIVEMVILSALFLQHVSKQNRIAFIRPEVKASSTTVIPTGMPIVNNTLSVVSAPQAANEYLVYENPDKQSKILLRAHDGEKLEVLEEKSSWYRVNTSTGLSGWLEKSSVVSTN